MTPKPKNTIIPLYRHQEGGRIIHRPNLYRRKPIERTVDAVGWLAVAIFGAWLVWSVGRAIIEANLLFLP